MSLIIDGIELEGIDSPCENVAVHIYHNEYSRNKTNAASLDYLSIYRKWPIQDEKIKKLRAEHLKRIKNMQRKNQRYY